MMLVSSAALSQHPPPALSFMFIPSWSPPINQFHHHHQHRYAKTLHRASSDGYDGISGLTDDGDFAIFGLNAEETSDIEQTKSNDGMNTGTAIGSALVGNMLFNEDILKSGRVDMGVGTANKYRDFRGNEIVPKVDPSVKEWLLEILPALDESDQISYAEGLTDIGFNPKCPSLCEIRYDDLDFMKVLHRRYLYKEITGQEHPFEP